MHKRSLWWLGIPGCVLLALPFLALIQQTPWHSFTLVAGDLASVRVSLGLGAVALMLVALLGTPLALWLARTSSRARGLVETLVLAALLTPPLAMGILLAATYGPYATVGQALSRLGWLLNNNVGAFILAQLYGGLAYYVMAARSAFEGIPRSVEEVAETLGASGWQICSRITLPLAMRGLASGLAVAWARMIGEFGIVMIFAYFPQGMSVRLYVDLQNDGVDAVYMMVWILLLTTLPLPLWILSRRAPDDVLGVQAGRSAFSFKRIFLRERR